MQSLQETYRTQIEELVRTSVKLGQLGYVTSHGGNLSYRVEENIVLITPTKLPKENMQFNDIVIVDMDGNTLFASEGRKATGELPIHLNILRRRSDIKGLVHAHPPVMTGFAIAHSELLSRPVLPEPVIETGPVLSVEYAEPLSDKLADAFNEVLDRSNAFLMKNHGVLVCNPEGVERGLEQLDMLEKMSHSLTVAVALGSCKELSEEEVGNLNTLLDKRDMPLPGAPGVFQSLTEAYFKK